MLKHITLLILFTALSSCANEDENIQPDESTGSEITIDATAPSEVSLVTYQAGDGQVIVNWVNPIESDFSHVYITYNISALFDFGTMNTDLEQITISNLSNQSLYTFKLHSVDVNDNRSNGVEITIMPGGVVTSDSIPPIIEEFIINETSIDTSLSSSSITGSLTVYDNSGTIERTPFLAFSPGGTVSYSASLIQNYAESINGFSVYTWTVNVPQAAPQGTYEVLTLQVRDIIGNQKNYWDYELNDLGFNTIVENN